MIDSVVLRNYFGGQQELTVLMRRSRKQIRYYFAWVLSAENSEPASLKLVTKIRHPKILNRKKKIN